MDPVKITKLAKLLKNEGDKVLDSKYKLTLSGPLLRALNDSFSLIIDTADNVNPFGFKVVKPNNASSDVFRDLQFIYDFVQKTVILCLARFPDDEKFEGQIDIAKFANLRTLELQRVRVKQVIGLQQFRAHLQQVICVRSIDAIRDVIVECGGDNSTSAFIWNALKTVDFSYNALEFLDDSFEYTPYLQVVNLSHNQVADFTALQWLPNLKVVDLSFNRLIKIPFFHADACRKMQRLLLMSNFIEDISNVSSLESLIDLDLSENCLLDHSALLHITALVALQQLNLKENPLACHPKHRQSVCRYLHSNTATVKFILDEEPLSKVEKSLVGNYTSYRPMLRKRTSELAIRAHGGSSSSFLGTPTGSINSFSTTPMDSKSLETRMAASDEMTTSMISNKRVKVREAQIAEETAETVRQDNEKRQSFDYNRDHLETKKQIESLREQYGSDWLQNQSGEMLQSVVGFETSRASPGAKEFINQLLQAEMTSSQVSAATVIEKDFASDTLMSSTPILRSKVGDDTVATFKSINDSLQQTAPGDETTFYLSANEDTIKEESVEEEETIQLSDEEEDEETFLVTNKVGQELFLVITGRHIRERDALTTRTLNKWSIKSLESVERTTADTITLNFDTLKKDRKQREYKLDKSAAHKLDQLFRTILANRPLSEMNQKLYRCAVCMVEFSREQKFNNSETFCPECKSSYVIEINETVAKFNPVNINLGTSVPHDKQLPMDMKDIVRKSESHSSIALLTAADAAWNSSAATKVLASNTLNNSIKTNNNKTIRSAGSMIDSSSCSKISKSESSFDSNQSVAGSAVGDRDVDFQGNESDIEILSNPSQSSIEVLDSHHSSRKHSSEERRPFFFPPPLLDQPLVHDAKTEATQTVRPQQKRNDKITALKNVILTESSSSGSVTDSICTAYENQASDENGDNNNKIKSSNKTSEKSADTSSDGDQKSGKSTTKTLSSSKSEVSVIGSMFNQLLQLGSKGSKVEVNEPEAPAEPYKYSYDDFSSVDHRLKLYLYQCIFDADSALKWLVRGRIFDENQTDPTLSNFLGLFVLSTTKFYVLKEEGQENDDPSTWLKPAGISGTVHRIITIRVLPFKVGVTFTIKGIGNVHLLLQCILRTGTLLHYLAEKFNDALPDSCSIEYRVSEDLMQKLAASAGQQKIKLLSLFNLLRVTKDDADEKLIEFGAFIVTDDKLLITNSDFKWLSASETAIDIDLCQALSNLVEVEDYIGASFKLNFMDDSEDGAPETWQLIFDTEMSCESAFETISQGWEKLFRMPLTKVTTTKPGNESVDSSLNSNKVTVLKS